MYKTTQPFMPTSSNSGPKTSVKSIKSTKSRKNVPGKLSKEDYASLVQTSTVKKKEHGRSGNTTENYEGHIRRGKEFLSRFSKEEFEAEANWQAEEGEKLSGEEEDLGNDGKSALHPQFYKAFNGNPIECTPLAISMFMTHKCFTEGWGKSTADALRAAFKRHYEQL